VLAGWDFEGGLTAMRPSILEPYVTAPNFTSNTPPPENRIGGGFSWVIENGWVTEGTYLSCSLAAAPGYELRLSMLSFDQGIPDPAGPPTWRISYVQGGPEIDLHGGGIPQQALVFENVVLDLGILVVDSTTPIEFHWFAENDDSYWGLDNVMIQGQVCLAP